MRSLLIALMAFSLASCGSSSESEHDTSVHTGNGQPNMAPILALTGPSSPIPTIKGLAVIREFGGSNTAALFVLLPSPGPHQESLEITEITRPDFLDKPKAGQLDQESINVLFLNSAIAMPQQEKDGLLSDYKGAGIVYFENYDGRLCTGQEFTITVASTFGDRKLKTSFVFTAETDQHSPSGDCKFSPSKILTWNLN